MDAPAIDVRERRGESLWLPFHSSIFESPGVNVPKSTGPESTGR